MTTVTLPRAVLVDIDGTLALRGDDSDPNVRRFYHWNRVGEDTPNLPVVELIQLIAAAGKHHIIVMSGRDGVCRPETESWLRQHGVPYDALYMREPKDNRADSVVKAELFRAHVAGAYEVAFVLDDRDQVVKLWRDELGLPCFQVAYGAF